MFPYLQQLTQAINQHDGEKTAHLLRKDSLYKKNRPKTGVTYALETHIEKLSNIETYCNGQLQPPYDEWLCLHFKSLLAIKHGNFIEACLQQEKLVNSFIKQFQTETTNASVPVLRTIATDLRILAKQADEQLRAAGKKDDRLEEAARVLFNAFGVCVRDNSALPQSKKWGTFYIINNLFRIYFALNNLKLCKNLIRTVEVPGFPSLEQFPVAQIVTYRFFVGRLHMYDGLFKEAEEYLSYAFRRCTKKSIKNKRLILLYLIPVKLLLGKMPRDDLLERFKFSHFVNLTKAIQSGNLRLFNETLLRYQDFFIQKGIYLILEKSKILTYRNLFKKIYLVLGKTTKIPLTVFSVAFKFMKIEIDNDEIECILANLIYSGYIKGYLAHETALVVSGKGNAFPPLSSVL